MAIEVRLKRLSHFDAELPLPSYETLWAAGADIRACLGPGEEMVIKPGERVLIPTGLAMEIPQGYEIQVRPRSGLSLKTGLLIVNSPGTIDSDYRGELKVIMGNLGQNDEIIKHGDRVAQLLVAPVVQAKFEVVDELTETKRGAGGFGSTGVE
ncbi:MAG: dUTP diphosphatase [Deltaproteobacteria bacterium]|nr:MAG: dUTP diphosphatase [Deltaproteobacteria bacterium]TNF31446.1 MAG: dUTP diphosphatase [Deltaproteobacteria bacterium]